MTMNSRHWRNFWARKKNVSELRESESCQHWSMLVLDCHWPKLSPLAKLLDWHDDVFLDQTGWHHVYADHPDLFSSAQSRWSAPWWCDRSHYADQHIAPKAAWPDLCWSGVGVPATLQPRVTGLKAEQATCRHFLWTSNKSPQIAGQTFRKPTL